MYDISKQKGLYTNKIYIQKSKLSHINKLYNIPNIKLKFQNCLYSIDYCEL